MFKQATAEEVHCPPTRDEVWSRDTVFVGKALVSIGFVPTPGLKFCNCCRSLDLN